MKRGLSVIVITKDCEELLGQCLESVIDLADEYVVVDNRSTDNTISVARSYHARTFISSSEDLGVLREIALEKAEREWILVLDSDERASAALCLEIKKILKSAKNCGGYLVPFRNHLFGKPVRYGGEDYKMLRVFRKSMVTIKPQLIHEGFRMKRGKPCEMIHHIDHYSYRTPAQLIKKFTQYALREAKQKYRDQESVSIKKLVLYGPHMFYARFIKDKGYKDGFSRLILDGAFAYMEGLTYYLLAYYRLKAKLKI